MYLLSLKTKSGTTAIFRKCNQQFCGNLSYHQALQNSTKKIIPSPKFWTVKYRQRIFASFLSSYFIKNRSKMYLISRWLIAANCILLIPKNKTLTGQTCFSKMMKMGHRNTIMEVLSN